MTGQVDEGIGTSARPVDETLPSSMETDPATENKQEKSAEELDQQRFAEIRRQEIRLIVWTVAIIAVLTAYAALLNAYVIIRETPRPYTLRLDHPLKEIQGLTYDLIMDWKSLPRAQEPVRPVLLINGSVQLPTGTDKQNPLILTDWNKVYTVTVVLPQKCTPGLHSGTLMLKKISGGTKMPDTLSCPVSIEISGSLWRNWFALRNWLIIASTLFLFLYFFCVIKFPRPSGFLILFDPLDPNRVTRSRLKLAMKPIAWFFPWKRSSISVRGLLRKAQVINAPSCEAEIIFIDRKLAPRLIPFSKRGCQFRKKIMDQQAAFDSADEMRLVSAGQPMYSYLLFCVLQQDKRENAIFFQWLLEERKSEAALEMMHSVSPVIQGHKDFGQHTMP